jgi:endonuclease YncB( thermonuclease family)
LSKLALAAPPKPKMPDDWKGTKLFQPVASAAGLIEAKGYSVAVSGIDVVRPEETCSFAGKSWPCGLRARTAFRAFLRGRAVVCTVPPEGGRDLIAAECRIGKQDVGQWLVDNGWARAVAGGPYLEAADKARSGKKGIFGAPPNLSGMPAMPAAAAPAPEAPSSILDEIGGVLKPVGQPAPVQ